MTVRAICGSIARTPSPLSSKMTLPFESSTLLMNTGSWRTPSAANVANTVAMSSGETPSDDPIDNE